MPHFTYTSKLNNVIPGWGLPAELCKTGMKLRRIGLEKGIPTPCAVCYAFTGPSAFPASQARLMDNFLEYQAGPDAWKDAMEGKIIDEDCLSFRFFPSGGDLQSAQMLIDIMYLAERVKPVRMWLPTQERAFVKAALEYRKKYHNNRIPENLNIRISSNRIDQAQKPRLPGVTYSFVSYRSEEGQLCAAVENEGQCGRCRACWDKDVEVIRYPIKIGCYYKPKATIKRLGWKL